MLEEEKQEGNQPVNMLPGARRIMRLQSRPEPLYLLLAINRGSTDFVHLVQAVGLGIGIPPSPSTTSHNIEELVQETLLTKRGRARATIYELTPLGRDSVLAFGTFHRRLLNPLVEYWKDRTAERLGSVGAEIIDDLSRFQTAIGTSPVEIDSEDFRAVPGVLHIMHALGGTTRLDILASLKGREKLPFKEVHRSLRYGTTPASTLSNMISELEQMGLVGRDVQGHGTWTRLTSLGEVTLDGFMDYHSSLRDSIVEGFKEQLKENFGISL